MSPELTCGVVHSPQPLTEDAAANIQIEAGGENLYRASSNGTFQLITNRIPSTPRPANASVYKLAGMSSDCDHVYFSSELTYPGLGPISAGASHLYEWHDGVISSISTVPGESGDVPAEVEPGGGYPNILGAVSSDGTRLFYSARRAIAGNPSDPGEVGAVGVFVRKVDAVGPSIIDVSASETTTPDLGATFQGATKDGSRVYFTANAGLTSASSSAGIDLYEYDLSASRLRDLSVGIEPQGAGVGGVLGFADDGSHVYLAARGRLAPGAGKTFADNAADQTYSIFDVGLNGTVRYVGALTDQDVSLGGSVLRGPRLPKWRSRVTPNGRYLAFESSVDLTRAANRGKPVVYLYDADSPAEPLVCVSCRFDGRPTINEEGTALQPPGVLNLLYASSTLVEREGRPEVYFLSRDPLAPGAEEGEPAIYEWAHNQAYLIARPPVGQAVGGNERIRFVGASSDGSDLYVNDPAALNWENPQGRSAVWDARIGGGFAEPPSIQGCAADVESSCQGAGGPEPSAAAPLTQTFVGPGNPQQKHKKQKHKKQKHKKQKHKKHKHKKHKKHKHQHKKHKHERQIGDRGAGK
jgi:hypothetical protein